MCIRDSYVTADEYLSGNVRRKLRQAQRAAEQDTAFAVNVEAPVSYTHLDVYKRQVLMSATSLNRFISSGRLKNLEKRVRAR